MSRFKLSQKSLNRLEGVHEDLVLVTKRAIEITPYDFGIPEKGGLRTVAFQKELYAQGRTKPGKIVTWTMNSPHILGHAVDYVVNVDGKYIDGDTAEELKYYNQVADAFLRAGAELNIPIIWGGTFRNRRGESRPDSGHVELNSYFYK
jgi:peptidoglycan L-alanyl-D-glutamate endopeptidase CwlK